MTALRFTPRIELQSFYTPSIKHPDLIGYAGIRLIDLGVVLHGASITQRDKEVRASLPRRTCQLGRRHSLLTFDYNGDFFEFCSRVVELVRAAHPQAFTNPPAAPITAAVHR